MPDSRLNIIQVRLVRERLPGQSNYSNFHISLTDYHLRIYYLSPNFNIKINSMKIKGLIIVVSVIIMASSCTQNGVQNVKLETKLDSVAYAIGVDGSFKSSCGSI